MSICNDRYQLCNVCGEKFDSGYKLRKHMKVHLHYGCSMCKMEFISNAFLVRHNRQVHSRTTYRNNQLKKHSVGSLKIDSFFERTTPRMKSLYLKNRLNEDDLVQQNVDDIRWQDNVIASMSDDESFEQWMSTCEDVVVNDDGFDEWLSNVSDNDLYRK